MNLLTTFKRDGITRHPARSFKQLLDGIVGLYLHMI